MDNPDHTVLDTSPCAPRLCRVERLTILDLPDGRIELSLSNVLSQIYARGFRLRARRLADFDVHYLAAGTATFESGEHSHEAGPGEIVFGSPGETVGVRAEGKVSLFHCHFVFAGVRPVVIGTSLGGWAHVISNAADSAMRLEHSLYLPDRLKIGRRDKVAELFAAMMRDQESHGPGRRLALKAHFLLLLRLVSEEVLRSLLKEAKPLSLGRAHLQVTKALRFIESNLSWPISVRDVADNLRLSPDYLGRAFRHYVGESVGSYLLRRRLVVAKDLLVSSEMSVKEVAAAVGFRDALYFSRVFRKEENMSPTEYVLEQCAPAHE